MTKITTEAERAARQRDVDTLRNYAETLPDGEEKQDVLEAISEGEQTLRTYAEAPPASPLPTEPDDDTTPDTDEDPGDDDLTDEDLQGMISDLRDGTAPQGAAPPAPAAPAQAAAPARQYAETATQQTLHLYSGEQGERLAKLERGRIDVAFDALTEAGKITPAQATQGKLLAYTLKGLPGTSTLKVYSETAAGREDAVTALLGMLTESDDLGILRTYSTPDHRAAERDRAPAAPAPRQGSVPVNEASSELTQKVRAYAEAKGITDFGVALTRYEEDNPQDVRRYSEGG